MKSNLYRTFISLTLVTVGFGLLGCGDRTQTNGVEEVEVVTSITITGNDRMRFEPTSFSVPAGEEITVLFRNIGQMPKETMGHNLAFLDKSVNANAFSAASGRHPRTAYIAPEYADRVIAASAVLGPGEEELMVFTAPSEPGDYPFVCSFPGHTEVGMRGIMRVVEP